MKKTSNYKGRQATITASPEIQDLVDEFLMTLEADMSPRTKQEYTRVAIQVLHARNKNRALTINSKAKWLQVRAVVNRMIDEDILDEQTKIYGLNKKWSTTQNRKAKILHEKVIVQEDFDMLLTLFPEDEHGQELTLACELSYYLGLRLNETLKLDPKDFIQEVTDIGPVWFCKVSSEHAKREESRLIPVPKDHLDLIERFTVPFTIPQHYVTYEFKKAVRKLTEKKNTPLTFHCLRHSFATRYHGPLDFLKEMLGHKSITTTMIYKHTSVKHRNNLQYFGY